MKWKEGVMRRCREICESNRRISEMVDLVKVQLRDPLKLRLLKLVDDPSQEISLDQEMPLKLLNLSAVGLKDLDISANVFLNTELLKFRKLAF